MSDKFVYLPLEIVLHILSYLPFEALLAFGETSRTNYRSHILCLKRLRLGVFEKRVHSMISCLQAGWATPDQIGTSTGAGDNIGRDYVVSVIQPRSKLLTFDHICKPSVANGARDPRRRLPAPQSSRARTQEQMIRIQNCIFSRIVNRYGSSLLKLEFMAYDLDIEGARVLGTHCQHSLRHLALRFEHQHIRDGHMRPSTWLHPAPSSTAWNLLIGVGRFEHLGITGLETLILERAGITSWQLMMLVRKNPRLTVLKLRTCRGAQPEFLNWLGGIDKTVEEPMRSDTRGIPGDKLETLWLEHCHRLLTQSVEDHANFPDESCDAGLEWVRGLTSLTSLSFDECMNIPSEYVDRANRTLWGIPEVILPYTLDAENEAIEVDPVLL